MLGCGGSVYGFVCWGCVGGVYCSVACEARSCVMRPCAGRSHKASGDGAAASPAEESKQSGRSTQAQQQPRNGYTLCNSFSCILRGAHPKISFRKKVERTPLLGRGANPLVGSTAVVGVRESRAWMRCPAVRLVLFLVFAGACWKSFRACLLSRFSQLSWAGAWRRVAGTRAACAGPFRLASGGRGSRGRGARSLCLRQLQREAAGLRSANQFDSRCL